MATNEDLQMNDSCLLELGFQHSKSSLYWLTGAHEVQSLEIQPIPNQGHHVSQKDLCDVLQGRRHACVECVSWFWTIAVGHHGCPMELVEPIAQL